MDYVKKKTSGAETSARDSWCGERFGEYLEKCALQGDLWFAQSCLYLTPELRRLYPLVEFVSPQTQCLPEINLRLRNNPIRVSTIVCIAKVHMLVEFSIIDLDIVS